MGSGQTTAGLTRGAPATRPGDGMTGAIGSAVTAAPRNRTQQQPGCGGRPACSSGPPACSSGVRFGNFSPVLVSEGGLEPPCPLRALAPQASASAYSATRTCDARYASAGLG